MLKILDGQEELSGWGNTVTLFTAKQELHNDAILHTEKLGLLFLSKVQAWCKGSH